MKDCAGMDSVFPNEDDEEEEEEEGEQDVEMGPSVTRVVTPEAIHENVINNETALVFMQQILVLANIRAPKICQVKGCGGDVGTEIRRVGSAIYLKWVRMSCQ
jgi:hypothetical protein